MNGNNGIAIDNRNVLQQSINDGFSTKSPAEKFSSSLSPNSTSLPNVNGTHQNALALHKSAMSTNVVEQLPPEIMSILERICGTNNVNLAPMNRLIDRAALQCWSDLNELLQELTVIPLTDANLLPPKKLPNGLTDDNTSTNREKKRKIFEFAEKHKKTLIKLLVILQWSVKNDDNQITIALNNYLLELRSAFIETNHHLVWTLDSLLPLQEPCPDLTLAAEILSSGKVSKLSNLEYQNTNLLTDLDILRTLDHMNDVLTVRMNAHEDVPDVLRVWHVHDGRVTFHVADEFELDLSISEDSTQAKLFAVDIRFTFRPTPVVADRMRNDVLTIVNVELHERGLFAAYKFLHDLTLSQKLTELYSQAVHLAAGLWSGHLRVEMLRRILTVQYWTSRSSSKSWIEISVDSGRANHTAQQSSYPTPYLKLAWVRDGKRVMQHDVHLDLVNLNFEDILRQVVAQHASHIFDSVYDRLVVAPLYREGHLGVDIETSPIDATACNMNIEVSQRKKVRVQCDVVTGGLMLSPVDERTRRFEQDIVKSKSFVDEFVIKYNHLRCMMAEAELNTQIINTSWQALPGLTLTQIETRASFGQHVIRAVFYKQQAWPAEWSLVAAFGSEGDSWQLVYGITRDCRHWTVKRLEGDHLHREPNRTRAYFDGLATRTTAMIALQSIEQSIPKYGIGRKLRSEDENETILAVKLNRGLNLTSIKDEILIVPRRKRSKTKSASSVVLASLLASVPVLEKAAAALPNSSIQITPSTKRLKLEIDIKSHEDHADRLIPELQYVDNLISCLQLVDRTATWHIQELTTKQISIVYHKRSGLEFSLGLIFDASMQSPRVQLLPTQKNPHQLVSTYVRSMLQRDSQNLARRLRTALAALTVTLPLLTCLQCLQGNMDQSLAEGMKGFDVAESQKWLKIHIITRDAMRYGLHFFALQDSFQRDVNVSETPRKMLARLEFELVRSSGRPTWLLRPAIENYHSYTRPSFASQALQEKLKRDVFSATNEQGWLALDNAAQCFWSQPGRLLKATHQTILDWLKTSQDHKVESSTATASNPALTQNKNSTSVARSNMPTGNVQPQKPSQNGPTRPNPVSNNSSSSARPTHINMPPRQTPIPQQSQNRQMNGTPNPQGGSMNRSNPVQQNQSSRVMTAAPQQVRYPTQNQQRRPGQPMPPTSQQQNNQQRPNNQRSNSNQHDIITLD